MPDFKKVFIEAFSRYYDLVYKDRLDTSKLLDPVTKKWANCSWGNAYITGVVQESVGMDIQLVNQINLIDRSRITLKAWDEILDDYEDIESFNIYDQFVESDALVAVDAPYKVKSRFTYLITYIIHHCLNIIDNNYKKSFNEHATLKNLEELISHKRIEEITDNSKSLYQSIKPIFHDEFQDDSLNIRHREHHRDGPTIFTGSSARVEEIVEDGNKSYRISIKEPILLERLVESLDKELRKCKKAYSEFEKFIESSFKIFDKYKSG